MKRILIGLAVLSAFGVLRAQEPLDATQVIDRSWQLYRAYQNEREEVEVTVKDEEGRREEKKSFTRWTLFDPEFNDKVTIKFTAPEDERGRGLLIHRQSAGQDLYWLKLPSRDRVMKYSVSRQNQYFGGTDFTYEDTRRLVGERAEDFDCRFITGLTDRADVWMIEMIPKSGVISTYGKRVFTLTKQFVIESVDYYDEQGQLVKIHGNFDVTVAENGSWRVGQVKVLNQALKRVTIVTTTKREFNTRWAYNPFTKSFLVSERRR